MTILRFQVPTGFKLLGLSSRFIVILWAVFGGFLYHILLSNYLTVLIKPSYDAPVDTAQDVWDRGLIINIVPVGAIWKQFLEVSGIWKLRIGKSGNSQKLASFGQFQYVRY